MFLFLCLKLYSLKFAIAHAQNSLSVGRHIGTLATHRASSEDSDQTARIRRLIRVSAVRTYQLVAFAVPRNIIFLLTCIAHHLNTC